MSSLTLEPDLPNSVNRCLSEALPGASISEVKVGENLPTVLVLEINQILAAFAFGSDEASYEALYAGFKKHFMSKDRQWAAMDVSFVYCLPPNSPPAESFCSRVETDVYFCRKFVVPLSTDIASSLSRLPFFPLAPISGSPLRPPSAQTLLQRSNVKAELARFLVMPGARSAQSILMDCFEKKWGEPEALSEAVAGNEHKNDFAINQTTLESLTIQNFRAYRKSKTFTFGSAITVLYGPNGFGKTSFFDALDFAVTGGIGRLPATTTDQPLVKAARHLDSGNETSVVSLTFKRGEERHTVIRDLADAKQASLDSKGGVGRKEVLTMLTGGESPGADRVDNFISLFRATHLFSQERQELTQDFHATCEISSNLVSRMLAFEDYVSGIKKTSEVQGLIKSAIDRANVEEARIEVLAARDRAELARLEGLVAANANPGAIEAELASLKQDIAHLGIEVKSSAVDTTELRGWRMQLESRIAEVGNHIQRLSKAMGDLQHVRTLALELATVLSMVTQSEASSIAAEASRATAEESLRASIGQLNLARSAEAAAQKLCDALAWVTTTKPEYERLLKEGEVLNLALEAASQQDVKLRGDNSAAASMRLAAETTVNNLSSQALASSQRLHGLQSLSRKQTEVHSAHARLKELGVAERACIESTAQLRVQLEQASAVLQSLRIQVARIEREVAARESESTEVKSLLAQLRGHVTEGMCLLCGVDHGSTDALLARIDARLSQEGPVTEAHARLAEKRGELTQLTEREAGHQRILEDGVARQVTLRSEREQHERVLSEFSQAAASLGIAVPSDIAWTGEQLGAAVQQEERALSILNGQRYEAVAVSDLAVKASDAAMAAVAKNEASIQTSRAVLEGNRQAIDRLVGDARRSGKRLDIDPKELQGSADQAAEQLRTAMAAVVAAQGLADQRKTDSGHSVQAASAAKKALEDAQRRRAAITSSISELTASLVQVGLSADSPDQSITDLLRSNSELQARVGAVRDRSMNIEVALDAATTAAALESLRVSLAQSLTLIEAARQERSRHVAWVKYFDNITKLLSTKQNAATDQFTREYGPRTAVIQRRLRPVYGFGDIQVSSRDGAIGVRVMRNGEALRPIDYFSQSQVQTLVLGLFLTACSSQTWSAFSSIIMDDPVTHFDDLNTYALLDLISGLLQSSDGARQFVISTCDEKFLQLARQKFRHLKEGAKFYRFSAIGAEGPLVNEIPV